jgi:TonB-linked SusC/RagA family outer membrane protein
MQFSFAQQKTVTGIVSDAIGPLAGANVVVQGTMNGATTNFDGVYSIKANQGDVLVFTYTGMVTKTATVGASNLVNAIMQDDILKGNEVVVVAYGSKTRDQLASAVTVLSSEDLSKLSPSTSIDNMLQGLAPGVTVTAGNGKPGQTAFVRIRGVGSINASNAPLYVIDGVVAPSMNSINPNDIESLSILKDAATASLYGSRAANGVIVITTKTGKKGKGSTISYSSRYGIGRKVDDNFRMMDASEKIQYERELAALGVSNAQTLPGVTASTPEEYQNLRALGHDWQKTLLRDAIIKSDALSISGGSSDMTYFMSVGHDRNTGIIRDISGFERINGRLNTTYKAKEWLDVGANLSITATTSNEPRDRNNAQNPFSAMYAYNPYEPKFQRDANGNLLLDPSGNPQFNNTRLGFSVSEGLINNPEVQKQAAIIGGLYANVKFSNSVTNTFRIGATNSSARREIFIKPGSVLDGYVGDVDNPGSKTDNGSNNFDYTVSNILNYKKSFNEKHNFSLSGLFEFNKVMFNNYSLTSIGFASGDLSVQSVAAQPTAASTNKSINTLYSFGSFLDYDFDRKYIFTASVRRDASSVFGVNNRYGIFWATSAAWNISNEKFMEGSKINNLKIRGSAGTSGNRAGIGNYGSLATIGFGSLNGSTTAIPTDNGNPDLGFEKNFIWDVGVEFGLFNNRLRGVVDYYERTTSDLLLNAPLSSIGGEPDGTILSNIGEMVNKGIEISLSGDIVSTKDFTFTLGGNIAFLDNKVTKLVANPTSPAGAPINNGLTTIRVGEELNTFFLNRWAGVNPSNGAPLFYDAAGNVTTVYNAADQHVLSGKSAIADFDGGVNLYLNYKGFDLAADFYYKVGHYTINLMESDMLSDGTTVATNQRVDAFNYWTTPGQTNVLPSPLYGVEAQQTTDRFLQKGDYLRLRNLTVGYNFPAKFIQKANIQSLRLFVQGQNLWAYVPYFKGDPEVGIGSGETNNPSGPGAYNLYSYPITQSVSLGLDIKF